MRAAQKQLGVSVLLLAGCSSPEAPPVGTTPNPPRCTATVTPFPAFGATEVPAETTIEFEMSEIEADTTITVDASVTGTTTLVGDRVVFQPDAPLAPGTTYNSTLETAPGTRTSAWSRPSPPSRRTSRPIPLS